jgi:hypothetical protein
MSDIEIKEAIEIESQRSQLGARFAATEKELVRDGERTD